MFLYLYYINPLMVLKSDIEAAYIFHQTLLKDGRKGLPRAVSKKIDLDNDFVQVISGVRRCGKSTLLRQLMDHYENIGYFNFEDPRLINFEVSDFPKLDEIIPEDVQAYFFDEIQNVEHWEIYIRQLRDRGKKVFVTGSNASLLSKDLGTRLTGRYLNVELFPFSFEEFTKFQTLEKTADTFKQYLVKGGFPEYLSSGNEEYLQNLFRDIVLRDIAIRYGIRITNTLMDLALFLVSNVGKETSYNKLKNSFNIGSANTISNYLNWFEDAYLFFFLQRFSTSAKKMAVNPRKTYVIDSGFARANSLSFSEDSGRLLENTVYVHLRGLGLKTYYFKEKKECDFLIFERNECRMALQVCYEVNNDNLPPELSGLREAMTYFDLKIGYIVTYDQADNLSTDDAEIKIIPTYKFFELVDHTFFN